jgi:hypothetical protein
VTVVTSLLVAASVTGSSVHSEAELSLPTALMSAKFKNSKLTVKDVELGLVID